MVYIGSLINGPLLAVFAVGLLTRRVDQRAVLCGLAAGFAIDVWFWLGLPGVSWLWWNVSGLVLALGIALGLAAARGHAGRARSLAPPARRSIAWLAGGAGSILAGLGAVQFLSRGLG